ncbi:MAG: class I SAM-dependent methyltransferase [Flavobacteriales bacterium]|nr:class I SAM-dependent methyltransferase [Flavobacteriales bacterium]
MKDFDHVAAVYDSQFTNTLIGKAQRKLVWNYLANVLNKNQQALELNCGTGVDAQFLSKRCKQVIATDISPEMVGYAAEKHPEANIQYQTLDINQLTTINGKFDLIFSNFGGLNCLSSEQWNALSKSLDRSLNPGGQFIAVIMSRNCAWERFYYKRKGDNLNRNRRRSVEPVLANVDGIDVKTWYYSPTEIIHFLSGQFQFIKVKPIGRFIPPSYMEPFFTGKKALFSALTLIESFSVPSKKSADKADHYLIHFKKN